MTSAGDSAIIRPAAAPPLRGGGRSRALGRGDSGSGGDWFDVDNGDGSGDSDGGDGGD